MANYRVECYRTWAADYAEFIIEAPNKAAAFQVAHDRLERSDDLGWTKGDYVDDVGIIDVVPI